MFVAARNEHLPDVLAMVHAKRFTPVSAMALTVEPNIAKLLFYDSVYRTF